eukprot:5828292-Lingulodinium_polyedra.AAC.1
MAGRRRRAANKRRRPNAQGGRRCPNVGMPDAGHGDCLPIEGNVAVAATLATKAGAPDAMGSAGRAHAA